MKCSTFFTVFTVICCLGLPAVNAQDGDKPERPKRGQRDDGGERPERGDRPRRGAGGAEGAGGPGMGQMLQRLPLMMALDADSDGVISAKEIEGAVAALKTLDKDGDGKITMQELAPQRGAGGPGGDRPGAGGGPAMMEQMFASRDKDGDGKLSGDEIPEMLKGRLERIDENGDGAIEKSELAKVAQRMGRGRDQGDRAEGDRPDRRGDGSGVKPRRPGSDKP